MEANAELAITLAPDLYKHLRIEAKLLDVPLEWLVASLVLDTFSDSDEPAPAGSD
jgi:hypothetical protein